MGRFYLRRALRIVPAFAVMLAVYAILTRDVHGIVVVGLYVANFALSQGHRLGQLTHTWSLSQEEQFYLLWPPLLAVLLRWRNRRRAVVPTFAALLIAA